MSTQRPSGELPSDTRGSFSFGTRLGLVFITQVASISAVLVGTLLLMIIVKAFRNRRLPMGEIQRRSPIYIYFISLLLADFIQAIGAILDIKWIMLAGVLEGPYCTTQGVFKQIGDAGVALSTMAIAFQTFSMIVLRWPISQSTRMARMIVSLIWLFLVLIISIGIAMHHTLEEPYYGNTRYWCWIRGPYLLSGIFLEYFWMWLAAFTSFVLYMPVAVVLFKHHNQRGEVRSVSSGASKKDENLKIARQMLFYPIIYTITVLPISVSRLEQFVHPKPPPFEATAFSSMVLASSGILNVMLFAYTRPSLLPMSTTTEVDDEIRSIPLSRNFKSGLEDQITDVSIGDLGQRGLEYEPWTPSTGRQDSGGLPDEPTNTEYR